METTKVFIHKVNSDRELINQELNILKIELGRRENNPNSDEPIKGMINDRYTDIYFSLILSLDDLKAIIKIREDKLNLID
jgi:hypothetical protein